jgi:hypothetical protein
VYGIFIRYLCNRHAGYGITLEKVPTLIAHYVVVNCRFVYSAGRQDDEIKAGGLACMQEYVRRW